MKHDQQDGVDAGLEVELRFLEGVATRRPRDERVLKALADLYTRAGRYHDGLDLDLKLSRMCPDESEVWYNLGCSYALIGKKEQAFEALNRAVDLGYQDIEWLGNDEDLNFLHDDSRFERLCYRIITAATPEDGEGDKVP
jgi:Flp pilus assembly protein TadD